MNAQTETKNKRLAMLISVALHGALLVIFLFAMAWRAPDPPLPEYGIELNFGMAEVGSGEIQPETPVGNENPETETTEQNDEPAEKAEDTTPERETAAEATPQTTPVAKTESPVTVKEEKKEPAVQKPVETKTESKKEPTTKPAEKVPAKTGTEGKPQSQGDDANKTGDKGDEKGSLDAKALYGNQGGGAGGVGLDLAGWNWDFIPKPNVPNNESGRVVFEIKVDENGEILSIRTIERSVSLEAEAICRKEIEKLTFTKTGSNVPAVSVGKITFVVRSH